MTEHKTHVPPASMSQMLEPQFRAYGYMFAGQNAGLTMYPGWHAPFAQLCVEIDATLGKDKQGFHWVQLKEKFGIARWYWEMQDESGMQGDLVLDLHDGDLTQRQCLRKEVPGELRARIRALVDGAEDACAQRCMDCGSAAMVHVVRGWLMALCETHASQRQQNSPTQDR